MPLHFLCAEEKVPALVPCKLVKKAMLGQADGRGHRSTFLLIQWPERTAEVIRRSYDHSSDLEEHSVWEGNHLLGAGGSREALDWGKLCFLQSTCCSGTVGFSLFDSILTRVVLGVPRGCLFWHLVAKPCFGGKGRSSKGTVF